MEDNLSVKVRRGRPPKTFRGENVRLRCEINRLRDQIKVPESVEAMKISVSILREERRNLNRLIELLKTRIARRREMFAANFAIIAGDYLKSLPVDERNARIEALRNSVSQAQAD